MAKYIKSHSLQAPRLKGIIVGAETLYDFQRELMEDVFNCPVYNRYGCTEFGNVASECKARKGMHINSDRFILEVVNDQGKAVYDEVGEIVITDLDNYAMPFIRYKTGDKGIITKETCFCAVSFPLLSKVIGRTSETLITKSGKKIHDLFFVYKLDRIPGIIKFNVVQKSYEEIYTYIVKDKQYDEEALTKNIMGALSELEELGFKIKLIFVNEIPKSKSGKMTYFISEVKEDAYS